MFFFVPIVKHLCVLSMHFLCLFPDFAHFQLSQVVLLGVELLHVLFLIIIFL